MFVLCSLSRLICPEFQRSVVTVLGTEQIRRRLYCNCRLFAHRNTNHHKNHDEHCIACSQASRNNTYRLHDLKTILFTTVNRSIVGGKHGLSATAVESSAGRIPKLKYSGVYRLRYSTILYNKQSRRPTPRKSLSPPKQI